MKMLTQLKVLNVGGSDSLSSLPDWIGEIKTLRKLLLSECTNMIGKQSLLILTEYAGCIFV